jgi:NitT/TauT family transport system ATP-binding protein
MRVRCQEVSFDYAARDGRLAAVDRVSIELGKTEFVSLVGPSGCGKSTLLKLIAGLLAPTSGRIEVDLAATSERLPRTLVFQDHCVFPWMTVLDNVVFGLEFRSLRRAEKRELAREFIAQVGLEAFEHVYPHELSVGMRQRVALARAFVARPQILLMDEPLAALDALSKQVLQEELLRMWSRHPTLVVYVTHDLAEAVLLGDRVLLMSGRPGRVALTLEVPHARPRDLRERGRPEIVELERRLWTALETDVRRGLDDRESAA